MQVAAYGGQSRAMVAPVSGNDVGIKRAEIKDGIRQVVCCKDSEGRIGLRVRGVNKGLFVAFVHKGSPGNYIVPSEHLTLSTTRHRFYCRKTSVG